LGKICGDIHYVWHYTYLFGTTVTSGVQETSQPNKRNRSIDVSVVTICYYLRNFSKLES